MTTQRLDAALILAKVTISESRKVFKFIHGLTLQSDRLFLLEKGPTTLRQCYVHMVNLRQARTLAQYGHERKPKLWVEKKKLNKLEGEAKHRAFVEGNCILCGKKGHWAKDCPTELAKTLRAMFTPPPKKKTHTRQQKRLNALQQDEEELETEEEEAQEEEEEDSNESEESENDQAQP